MAEIIAADREHKVERWSSEAPRRHALRSLSRWEQTIGDVESEKPTPPADLGTYVVLVTHPVIPPMRYEVLNCIEAREFGR